MAVVAGVGSIAGCIGTDVLALSGRVDEARDRIESLVRHVNLLGLVAEEVDGDTGAHLGNLPQTFSHIGIDSTLYIEYATGHESAGLAPIAVRLGDPIGGGR